MEHYEHLRPEELNIAVQPHEVMVVLGDRPVALNTEDSALWIYPERFAMLSHIALWHEDGTMSRWYGVDNDTVDVLHEAGITMVTPPHPTLEILGEWWNMEMQDFDRELAHYDETGQL